MSTNLPLLETPATALRGLAERARAARLRRDWSRLELARRAGVSPAMIRNFEKNGRIGLVRLLALAAALGALDEFTQLFPPPPARSLDELEATTLVRTRQRGRTLRRHQSASGGTNAR
jgi:transcriptional regulator with XRE-family HTH domain